VRKLAILGALISILLLSSTGYLGSRMAQGDLSVKTIHLACAISGTIVSILSHSLALVLLLRRPSS